jgi:wyosine [tRNA(Phe)-imidazoG37] synthetase (radical SAM superfamily)
MALLRLQNGIVYGPIASRRLGCSLGLNILPLEYKLCSLNCVYCQYGWTKTCTLDVRSYVSDLPTAKDVAIALRESLLKLKDADMVPSYITFSGNGEPTLHPGFEEIVRSVKKVRDELAPNALLAILSNSTTVSEESVRRALEQLDVRVMKLDCGEAGGFDVYNRPCAGIDFERIVNGLSKLKGFSIQTLFTNLNSDESSIRNWIDVIETLKPNEVQVYTLDRSAPLAALRPVSKDKLEEIARRVTSETGVTAKVY